MYKSDTTSNKKFLPRSILEHFVDMESDTQLYRVCIPNTNEIVVVRRDDFKIIQDESLPGISTLLDRISRQLEQEEKQENPETSEQQLINAFTAVSAERPLIAYMSDKKKKYNPNFPKSFSDA